MGLASLSAVAVILVFPLLSIAQALPEAFQVADTEDFRLELAKFVSPAPAWTESLQKEGFDFLCLGESHYSEFRELYSKLVLKRLAVNRLAIEADPVEAKKLDEDFRTNGKVAHLGGDFTPILKALAGEAETANVIGVEPTKEEDRERTNESLVKRSAHITRDGFIARHVAALLGKAPTVALYGALHCSELSSGLGFSTPFFRILKNLFPQKKLISVLLVPESDTRNPVRIFADSFGFLKEDIVIKNARNLDPRFYNYRTDLEQVFRSYNVILLPRRTIPVDTSDK